MNFNSDHDDRGRWYIRVIPVVIILLIVVCLLSAVLGFFRFILRILTSPVFWIAVIVICIAIHFMGRRR